MKTVNVAELEGAALDWAVADALDWMIEGDAIEYIEDPDMIIVHHTEDWDYEVETTQFRPSTDWGQGGPLIESIGIDLCCICPGLWEALAVSNLLECTIDIQGPTPLIAACRAIVAAKFGDTVEVSEESL